MLSADQLDFYSQHGYLMVENAVSEQQLAALQSTTLNFIDQSRNVSENTQVFDLDEGHSSEQPRLTRIKLPHLQDPLYWDILCSENITSILKALLGPDVRLHNSKLNTKAPAGGAAVEWHQDWAFYPHTNDDMLALGILLDDVGMDNGPLLLIPGSHRGGVLDHSAGGVFCGAINPDDTAFDVSKAVALTGKAGDMSIHHVRTLHGSAPNLSDRTRMLLFYEAGAADAWPITGIASACTGLSQPEIWQFMRDRMVCGEQTLQPRLSNVPVKMPLPPAPDSSSIFKVQKSGGAQSAFKN